MFSPQDPLLRPSPVPSSNHLQHLNTILPNEIQQLTKLVEECKKGNAQARALQEALLLDSQPSKKAEINQVSAMRRNNRTRSGIDALCGRSDIYRLCSSPRGIGITDELG